MAAWVAREGSLHAPDASAVDAAIAHAEAPFRAGAASDIEGVRERLYATMWDDTGIVRDAASLARADTTLTALAAELDAGVLPAGARDRAYNLCWHDWLNLGNLIAVSRAIVRAAQARENSCGAHFRADFPEATDLATAAFTRIVQSAAALRCEQVPVRFTRVRPGESLLPI